ncbi:MAG: MFS transporter [Kiritimatiellia bacterium]
MKFENIPFAPKRWPFPYCWLILFMGTLGVIMSVPGQTIGVAAFIEPLMRDVLVSRTRISIAYGAGTLLSAAMMTFAGKLYDRIGARQSALLATWLMGATLIAMSYADRINNAIQPNANGSLAATIFWVLLILGFFGLRFGQGMLSLFSRNMVMKWFLHYRGLANGIMGMFIGLAFAASPVIFNQLIRRVSWQKAWLGMGVFVLVGFATVVALFFRDNPRACGLEPDGGRKPKPGDPQHAPVRSFTLKETMGIAVFWTFALSLSLQALYGTAFAFHVESIMVEKGFAVETAYQVFMPAAMIAVFLGLVAGWISDHVHLKVLLLLQLGGMALSMLALLLGRSALTFPLLIGGNGLSSAMFGILIGVTWPRYFGQAHLGAISGFQMTFNVLFSAIGPAFFALSARLTGNYHTATGFCLAAVLILMVAATKAQHPTLKRISDEHGVDGSKAN